jgi:hypothetical protein
MGAQTLTMIQALTAAISLGRRRQWRSRPVVLLIHDLFEPLAFLSSSAS